MRNQPDKYARNRGLYTVEAAVEYFISLLITGAFLATLLTRSGVSDRDTGIISQLASFAFTAQFFSVFVRKTKGLKLFVTVMHLINQLLFVSLYLIPIISVPPAVKTLLFVVMFLGGHFVANIVTPYKLSWFNSFVPDNERGIFTAKKEMVSLVGGMAFSMGMGALIDALTAAGKEDLAFTLSGITILILAIIHFLTTILVRDHEDDTKAARAHVSLKAVGNTLKNTTILKIIVIDTLWHTTTGVAIAFYGVYQTGDLGFSLKYASFVSIMSALSRVAVSIFFGKYADKHSWPKALTICFIVLALGYGVNIFTVPSNGHVMFMIYSCLYGVSMGGINSGLMNIIFEFVPAEERPAALGIKSATGGLTSFFAALAGGAILDVIQKNGNMLFGINVYAQQVLSAIACLICVALVIYMYKVILKMKKKQ